jgi:signal transduction histidine kinase
MNAAARLVPPLPDEKLAQYVEYIQGASRQIDRLVRDLLDISSMESGNFAVQQDSVDLRALLQETRQLFDMQARAGRVALHCEIDAGVGHVSADRDRLSQVIANLLENAFKFASEGGSVSLRAHRREDDVEIVVQDSGQGIPAAELPRIFDRFWQGDRASRTGAGLGLAICKGVVEAHGGRIWAESTLGDGTTFHVTIPSAEA